MRGARRAAPSVPVILITDERAILVARLDDKHPVGTHDDQGHDIRAVVAWRIARQYDVVGGQPLAQLFGGSLRELCPWTVSDERRERRAESPHFDLSAPRRRMLDGRPASPQVARSSCPLSRLTCD